MAFVIYDCFTFFNELDLLEIRFNVLNAVVDKFVLVEADKTFTGSKKPFYYEENKERFKVFEEKIIHIKVEDYPKDINPWSKENYLRNCIVRGLNECKDEDVIIISDVDEIPNPDAVKAYAGDKITGIEMDVFNYNLNLMRVEKYLYFGAKICRYKNMGERLHKWQFVYNDYNLKKYNQGTTINKIKNSITKEIILNGGWHFSFMGGPEMIKKKLNTYANQELNSYQFYSEEAIQRNLLAGKGVLGEGKIAQIVLEEHLPEYILENIDKYHHLILDTTQEIPQIERQRSLVNFKLYYFIQMIRCLFYPLKWAKNLSCKYR